MLIVSASRQTKASNMTTIVTDITNNALEFNLEYMGKTVVVQNYGTEYRTSATKNQAWTNCHGIACLTVFGRASALRLDECVVVGVI